MLLLLFPAQRIEGKDVLGGQSLLVALHQPAQLLRHPVPDSLQIFLRQLFAL